MKPHSAQQSKGSFDSANCLWFEGHPQALLHMTPAAQRAKIPLQGL